MFGLGRKLSNEVPVYWYYIIYYSRTLLDYWVLDY